MGDKGFITVTVTGSGSDCDLSGYKVTAKLMGNSRKVFFDNGKTTVTGITDSNGEAAFEVLAKKKGHVNIRFTVAGSKLKDIFKINIK